MKIRQSFRGWYNVKTKIRKSFFQSGSDRWRAFWRVRFDEEEPVPFFIWEQAQEVRLGND